MPWFGAALQTAFAAGATAHVVFADWLAAQRRTVIIHLRSEMHSTPIHFPTPVSTPAPLPFWWPDMAGTCKRGSPRDTS